MKRQITLFSIMVFSVISAFSQSKVPIKQVYDFKKPPEVPTATTAAQAISKGQADAVYNKKTDNIDIATTEITQTISTDPLVALQNLGANIKALPIFCSLNVGWNYYTLGSNAEIFVTFNITKQTIITGVTYVVAIGGDFVANDTNSMALYRITGSMRTKVAELTNSDAHFKGYGLKTADFVQPYIADPGLYRLNILYCRATEVAAPAIAASYSTYSGLENIAPVKFSGYIGGKTSLSATYTAADETGWGVIPNVFLY